MNAAAGIICTSVWHWAGQKSFRHLQIHSFRLNGGIRKIKRSSISLHSLMQSRRSRARRSILQRGSSAAAAMGSGVVPLPNFGGKRTLSTASAVAASPWNTTRKAYKEIVRKTRTPLLILDAFTWFCRYISVFGIQWSRWTIYLSIVLDWDCCGWVRTKCYRGFVDHVTFYTMVEATNLMYVMRGPQSCRCLCTCRSIYSCWQQLPYPL